ncbi:MAG: hypothetical protein WAV20_02700 [Blastocatellia bacterium]
MTVTEAGSFGLFGKKINQDHSSGSGEETGGENESIDALLKNLSDALLSLGPGCKKFFGGEERVKRLADDLNGIHIARWDSNQAIDHGQRFAYTFWRVETVIQYWGRHTLSADSVAQTVYYNRYEDGAIDAQTYNTIILGPAYFNEKNEAEKDWSFRALYNGNLYRYQRDVLVHEFMHLNNNLDDAGLAKKWGLDTTLGASQAISQFLANDCNK